MMRILIFLGLLLLVIFSCSGLANKKKISTKKIKEFILYNTMSEGLNADIKDLSAFRSKSFNDSATVALLGSAVRVPGNYIWKGAMIGVIRYGEGDSIKIKVSRYGGFFKSFSDNKYYSFPDQNSIKKWDNLVDTFIHDTIK
jgi:hypothetical protein